MHLVLPYASAGSAAAAQALTRLHLPQLERLLGRLVLTDQHSGDEHSLSPPHDWVLAGARGWPLADGLLPFAADAARADGLAVDPDSPDGWGLLSPCHWHLGTEQVSLTDPADLRLEPAEAHALFDALRRLYDSDGWRLHWGAPTRWYVSHPSLRQLPSAALDRVVGRNVDLWLNDHPSARQLLRPARRLQAEAQMLLHSHPVNQAREDRGLWPVNSVWLSGTGPTQPVSPVAVQVDDRLRAPALAEDWAGWTQAWAALDAGLLQQALAQVQAGQPLRLWLCGERHAQCWQSHPLPWWRKGLLAPAKRDASAVLAAL